MRQKMDVLKKLMMLVLVPALLIIAGCKEDETIDITSAAYLISESDKLTIPANVDLPANAPKGNTRVATYYAVGVQKYKAQQKAGSDPAVYEWVFVAPQADLFDASNAKIGTHYAGPSWDLSDGKGLINGQAFSPAKTSPSSDASTIDWLLLMPKTGTTPTGVFADADYIQRIATVGGKAPTTAPTSATQTTDVAYTAIYRFTKINE